MSRKAPTTKIGMVVRRAEDGTPEEMRVSIGVLREIADRVRAKADGDRHEHNLKVKEIQAELDQVVDQRNELAKKLRAIAVVNRLNEGGSVAGAIRGSPQSNKD